MKVTHPLLWQWLRRGRAAAVRHLVLASTFPDKQSRQSEWTTLSHFTLACAMSQIIPPQLLGQLSLRVSPGSGAPGLWPSAQSNGVVHDWSPQQMGLDFCLMGPTGKRYHYLTAESEADRNAKVSIHLGDTGYIWDWSKLLGDRSEHRLMICVVRGHRRRAELMRNMSIYFNGTFGSAISRPDGIGGYILASAPHDKSDSWSFVVREDLLDFQPIPPGTY